MNNIKKLSIKEKIGYGLGDTASNLYFQMFINFLLFFYTDVFFFFSSVAGTMFMLTRFWDAVNDPMMGIIADRTNTKWGKFRPYLLWVMLPMAIIGVLMFTSPDLSMGGKIVYAYITYILMMMAYTAINIPYSALMGVLSPHSTERTSASTYRFVLAFAGAFIIQWLTIPLVESFGHESEGCAISNNIITIEETDTKASKIIIEADDGRDQTERKLYVKIHKKEALPPSVNRPIDDFHLTEGFSIEKINISDVFTNPGKNNLTYKVKSSNDDIVEPTLENNNTLIIKEKNIGQAEITLTANCDKYRKKDYKFLVNVSENGNLPPKLVRSIQDVTYDLESENSSIDLSEYFKDEEPLTYSVESNDKRIAIPTVEKNKLSFELKKAGISNITVTAEDMRGGIVNCTFYVKIQSPENDAPAAYCSIDNIELNEGFGEHKIDISKAFLDLDGDNLTISVKKVNMAKGFPITMGIFGILAMIFFYITFKTTTERVQPSAKQETSLKNDLKDLMGNKPWMILLVMGIFTLGYVIIRMGTIMYYFKYYIGNEWLAGTFMVTGTVAVIAGTASTQYLSKLLGKKKLYLIVMGLSSILTMAFYYVPKEQIIMIFVVHILISLVMAPQAPLIWSMYADTADYSEWKNGRRATGLVFSAATFSQKFGMAIGGGIAGWLLSAFNFEPNVTQSPETITGIKLMMSYIPAAATIVAVIAAFFYPLDDKTMHKIETDLQERNAE